MYLLPVQVMENKEKIWNKMGNATSFPSHGSAQYQNGKQFCKVGKRGQNQEKTKVFERWLLCVGGGKIRGFRHRH